MNNIKRIKLVMIILFFSSCNMYEKYSVRWKKMERISVRDAKFYKGDKPYYFIGTNYWYAPIIGSEKLGDRERLKKELDLLQSVGIDNLRILVGAEGDGGDSQVDPALQPQQGVYNQDLLDGLDYLMMQLRKRNMYAVLYLTNNWIWSGGMSTYLKWNGYGEVPNPFLEQYTWPQYKKYTSQFHSCQPCKEAFYHHIEFIIGRTNSYTGLKYTEDHTVMSWQVANEPRVFSKDHEEAYSLWLKETVEKIESLDSTHLISTGAEGKESYLRSIEMYKRLHDNDHIDYLTMHMWPKNWLWYKKEKEEKTTKTSIQKAINYMDEHIMIARKFKKPIVMSEFGFPRDKESLSPQASVKNRNEFYAAIFQQVKESSEGQDVLAGLNFWGFAGYAQTDSERAKWLPGDDFTADPPQEPQGLNSVFATDTLTLELIRKTNEQLTGSE